MNHLVPIKVYIMQIGDRAGWLIRTGEVCMCRPPVLPNLVSTTSTLSNKNTKGRIITENCLGHIYNIPVRVWLQSKFSLPHCVLCCTVDRLADSSKERVHPLLLMFGKLVVLITHCQTYKIDKITKKVIKYRNIAIIMNYKYVTDCKDWR